MELSDIKYIHFVICVSSLSISRKLSSSGTRATPVRAQPPFQPWQPLFCFLFLGIDCFSRFFSRRSLYLSFLTGLFHLAWCPQVYPCCCGVLGFFSYLRYNTQYHIWFIFFNADGHLSRNCVNNAAMNKGVRTPVSSAFCSFEYIPRSGVHMVITYLNL